MDEVERQPLPLPGARPITEADRQPIHDAIARALKDVLSGPRSYYPDGVQQGSEDMGADLDRFIASLENFKNDYVIDPSDVMRPMVDQLRQRVDEFKKFHEDRTNDNMQLPQEKTPTTRDNRWIEVKPFPGPFSPPLPWSDSQRPKFRSASAPPPDDAGGPPDNPTPVAYPRLSTRIPGANSVSNDLAGQPTLAAQPTSPLGIYSGKPMRQWIVHPLIWGSR